MLKGLFSYENPIWHFFGKFWSVLILNVLWIICSIPIFTIGASTTAVYYVTLKLVRNEDGYVIRSFFRSFKENFKQATTLWLIFLFAGAILGLDLWAILNLNVFPAGWFRSALVAVFIVALVLWLVLVTYIFPLLARFENTSRQAVWNALLISIRYIGSTFGMLLFDLGILFLMFGVFTSLFMFGFPLLAFANSFFFERIFRRYIPKEEEEKEREMRPLFMDEDAGSSRKEEGED